MNYYITNLLAAFNKQTALEAVIPEKNTCVEQQM